MLWLKILKLFHIVSKKHFDDLIVIRAIKKHNLFDAKYYLQHNPDVKKSKMNPAQHYLNHGWKEGRNPSKNFDNNAYLQFNPDVAASKICPLSHYINHGIKEGRIARTVSGKGLSYNRTLKQKIKHAWEYPIRVHEKYHRLKDKIREIKKGK